MSRQADQKRLENLIRRLRAAPRGSKQRRHLRRAVERAVEQLRAREANGRTGA
jgi:hypothetical protein